MVNCSLLMVHGLWNRVSDLEMIKFGASLEFPKIGIISSGRVQAQFMNTLNQVLVDAAQ